MSAPELPVEWTYSERWGFEWTREDPERPLYSLVLSVQFLRDLVATQGLAIVPRSRITELESALALATSAIAAEAQAKVGTEVESLLLENDKTNLWAVIMGHENTIAQLKTEACSCTERLILQAISEATIEDDSCSDDESPCIALDDAVKVTALELARREAAKKASET